MTLPAKPPVAAETKPWRSAPIADQIEALKRAQEGQRRYHKKIMAVGSNANPTFYRLEDWRLSSALRTLERLQAEGVTE